MATVEWPAQEWLRDAAAVAQGQADATAANSATTALVPIFADLEKSLADAKAERSGAFATAWANYSVATANALAAAMNRWASAQGSPDATYQASLVTASTARTAAVDPAYAAYSGAYSRAIAQWVTDLAPAAVGYFSALSSNALAAFNAITSASQTADEAIVDAMLAHEITSSTLGQALADAEAGATQTWIGAVAPAVEVAANAQANNAATAKGTVASLIQTLVDTETDHATVKISSDSNAVIALSSAQVMLLTALASQLPTFSSASPAPILPPLPPPPYLPPPLYGPPSTEAWSVFQPKKESSESIVLGNAQAIKAFAESLLPAAKNSNQERFKNYSDNIGAFTADHHPELWAQALQTISNWEQQEERAAALNITLGTQGTGAGLGRNREEILRENTKLQGRQRERMVKALAEYVRLLKQAGDGSAILALKQRVDFSQITNSRPGGGASAAEIEAALRAKLEPPLISPF